MIKEELELCVVSVYVCVFMVKVLKSGNLQTSCE